MMPSLTSQQRKQEFIFLSQKTLQTLYGDNPPSVLSFSGQNIVWVDTTSCSCLTGYYQLQSYLQNIAVTPPRTVNHLQYHILPLDTGSVIVTGQYKLIQKKAARTHTDRIYQVSLVWTYGESHPRLMYLHISAAVPQFKEKTPLCFSGRKAETYRLPADEILYIEAENIYCKLHGILETYHVCHSISQIEKLLPMQFLRVHRSFIINRQYVTRMYRYAVELSYQYTIPVPEKKYMKVVCDIEQFQEAARV